MNLKIPFINTVEIKTNLLRCGCIQEIKKIHHECKEAQTLFYEGKYAESVAICLDRLEELKKLKLADVRIVVNSFHIPNSNFMDFRMVLRPGCTTTCLL
jgi:hypothetical protein